MNSPKNVYKIVADYRKITIFTYLFRLSDRRYKYIIPEKQPENGCFLFLVPFLLNKSLRKTMILHDSVTEIV